MTTLDLVVGCALVGIVLVDAWNDRRVRWAHARRFGEVYGVAPRKGERLRAFERRAEDAMVRHYGAEWMSAEE